MNKPKQFIAIISAILFMISCEKVIEFKTDDLKSKIVLYSILDPDSMITCQIATSYSITDQLTVHEQITNAVIKLYKDDVFVENLTYFLPDNSSYWIWNEPTLSYYKSSGTIPEEGSEYRLEVELEGYESVYATASLPGIVDINDIDTSATIYIEYDWSYSIFNFNIRFQDPPDRENFYRIATKYQNGRYYNDRTLPFDSSNNIMINTDYPYLYSSDPLLSSPDDETLFDADDYNPYKIFSDEKISGKEYNLSFWIRDYEIPIDTNYYEFAKFGIILQSISKELYYYLDSYKRYQETNGDVLSEPVIIYSNVKNGLGIFCGLQNSVVTLQIGSYPVEGIKYFDIYGFEY